MPFETPATYTLSIYRPDKIPPDRYTYDRFDTALAHLVFYAVCSLDGTNEFLARFDGTGVRVFDTSGSEILCAWITVSPPPISKETEKPK